MNWTGLPRVDVLKNWKSFKIIWPNDCKLWSPKKTWSLTTPLRRLNTNQIYLYWWDFWSAKMWKRIFFKCSDFKIIAHRSYTLLLTRMHILITICHTSLSSLMPYDVYFFRISDIVRCTSFYMFTQHTLKDITVMWVTKIPQQNTLARCSLEIKAPANLKGWFTKEDATKKNPRALSHRMRCKCENQGLWKSSGRGAFRIRTPRERNLV